MNGSIKRYLSAFLGSCLVMINQISLAEKTAEEVAINPTAVIEEEKVEPTPTFTLDPTIITAQRRLTSDLNTPAAVSVITKEDLQETGALTVFDALLQTPNMGFSSYAPGGDDYGMSSTRVNIRGLEKGTLVLVNGAPINLLNYNGTGGIPRAAVERIEIIRGASSTLYGAEALGGVINIITKEVDGEPHFSVGGGVGNYRKNWHVGGQFGKTSLYFQREYYHDRRPTNRDNTSFTRDNTLEPSYKNSLYFSHKFNNNLKLDWLFMQSEFTNNSYNRSNQSLYSIYEYMDRRNTINLIYENDKKDFLSSFSYNMRKSNGDAWTARRKKWGKSSFYDMYALHWDTQKTWTLRDGKDHLTAGVTWSQENYKDPLSKHGVLYKKGDRNNYAFYGSYDFQLTPKFSVILGLRGQLVDDYAMSKEVLLPQIQTLYKVNEKTSLYTNIGKSFQMPAINQYFSKPDGKFNHLDPQTGWTYEAGVKIVDEKKALKIGLFHMDIKDQFVWKTEYVDGIKYDFLANEGDFRNTGIEVEFLQRINDRWKWNAGISFSKPEDNSSGQWNQASSRIQGNAGITYQQSKWTGNVNFQYIGDREDSYYKLKGRKRAMNDGIFLNASLGYQPNKNHLFSLNLYNILDRKNSLNKYESLDLPFHWTVNYTYTF